MRKLGLLIVPALAAFGVMAPAHAANSTVHVDVDVAAVAPLADCDVSVPAGANGIAVLDAAKASGCISSYKLKQYSFGKMIECIDDVCQAPDEALNIAYWAIYQDGAYASTGVEGLSVNGGTVGFSFETWATGLV